MNISAIIHCLMAASVVLASGCADSHNEHKDENADHEHNDEIIIKSEQIAKLGIKTTVVAPSNFQNVIKCGGEVLPSTTSQTIVSAKSDGIVRLSPGISTGVRINQGGSVCSISSEGISGGDPRLEDNARLNAAQTELRRVEKLYSTNLATEKELQEARLAVDIARNAVAGNESSSLATSPISGVVSQLLVTTGAYVTTGTPIAVVNSSNRLILRASVPQCYYRDFALIKSANFKTPYCDNVFELDKMQGQRLSAETMATTANGYFNLDFSFVSDGTVAPGSYVEIYLLGTEETNVISVPMESVIEEEGKYSVFVREENEHFEKRTVTIGRTDGRRIEIKDGLKNGDNVVTEGTIYVKLAANSGAVPEGHHHH